MSKSLTIKATITATSNKQSRKFKTDNPRKSLYITVDEENKAKLEEFGLTEYTPKDSDAKPYFIVKAAAKLDHYKVGVKVGEVSGLVDAPNFTSVGDVNIALYQDKSETGQTYTRAYAVNGVIEEVKAQNPFTDIQEF